MNGSIGVARSSSFRFCNADGRFFVFCILYSVFNRLGVFPPVIVVLHKGGPC